MKFVLHITTCFVFLCSCTGDKNRNLPDHNTTVSNEIIAADSSAAYVLTNKHNHSVHEHQTESASRRPDPLSFMPGHTSKETQDIIHHAIHHKEDNDAWIKQMEQLDKEFYQLSTGELDGTELPSDTNWRFLFEAPNHRKNVRELLLATSNQNSVELICQDEPGERIELDILIVDERTHQPVIGASIELYHADASGNYMAPGGEFAPRIYGVAKTDSTGSCSVKTILPGSYPGDDGLLNPPHVHCSIHSESYPIFNSMFVLISDVKMNTIGHDQAGLVATQVKGKVNNYKVTIPL